MRERLQWVAGQLISAMSRRAASPNAAAAATYDAVLAALRTDYGSNLEFEPRSAPVPNDRMAALADVFDLDALSADLLAVAVAADLDANIGMGYNLVSGGTTSLPTIGLALELCGLPTAGADAATRLLPGAPLRNFRLLDVVGDHGWLARTLRVPDQVRAHLVGADGSDPTVGGITIEALPYFCTASRIVARSLAAGAGLIWIRAAPGAAGTAVAAAGFAECGLRYLTIDVRLIADENARADVLPVVARDAALAGMGLIVAGADELMEPSQRVGLQHLFAAAVPVAAVGSRPWNPGVLARVPLTVDAPILTAPERLRIWTDVLGTTLGEKRGQPSLTTLRMAPEDILVTARYARTLASAKDEKLELATVREAARILGSGAGGSSSVTRPPAPAITFNDLVLPPRILDDLTRIVRWAAHRDEVLARGPVHGKGGKGSGITALFTGNPGTGKTLAAHVVADELNLELLQVDLSAVVDKYIGETEKNLERVFREAESRNVVLFFDEADSLFGSRSAVRDARDRYANQEVSYLLQRMEHFDGITVLATNLRGNLDPAFSRRMQFIVHFPDPDAETRHRLWQQHLAHAGGIDPADPVDIDLLAETVELTGGDIRNVVLAATYDAAGDSKLVGMAYIRAAALREYVKLGRRAPQL